MGINTYMTTKENEIATFDLDRDSVERYFGTDLKISAMFDGFFLVMLSLISALIVLMLIAIIEGCK